MKNCVIIGNKDSRNNEATTREKVGLGLCATAFVLSAGLFVYSIYDPSRLYDTSQYEPDTPAEAEPREYLNPWKPTLGFAIDTYNGRELFQNVVLPQVVRIVDSITEDDKDIFTTTEPHPPVGVHVGQFSGVDGFVPEDRESLGSCRVPYLSEVAYLGEVVTDNGDYDVIQVLTGEEGTLVVCGLNSVVVVEQGSLVS